MKRLGINTFRKTVIMKTPVEGANKINIAAEYERMKAVSYMGVDKTNTIGFHCVWRYYISGAPL